MAQAHRSTCRITFPSATGGSPYHSSTRSLGQWTRERSSTASLSPKIPKISQLYFRTGTGNDHDPPHGRAKDLHGVFKAPSIVVSCCLLVYVSRWSASKAVRTGVRCAEGPRKRPRGARTSERYIRATPGSSLESRRPSMNCDALLSKSGSGRLCFVFKAEIIANHRHRLRIHCSPCRVTATFAPTVVGCGELIRQHRIDNRPNI